MAPRPGLRLMEDVLSRIGQTNKGATLLPTEEIVRLAKHLGVDFGFGDPKHRIRYYIKIGLLPHQVRKPKYAGESTTVGHLPVSTVKTLSRIQELKEEGSTYKEIAEVLIGEEYGGILREAGVIY